jgi:uroporphyrinogen decarboxylase
MVEEMTKFERVNAVMEMREPDRVPVYPYILTHGVYAEGWRLPDIMTDLTLDSKKSAQCTLKTLEMYDYDMVIGSYQDLYMGVTELGGKIKIPNKFGSAVSMKEPPVMDATAWDRVQKLLPYDPRKSGRAKSLLESYKIVSDKVGKTTPVIPCWWPGPTAAMCMFRGPEMLSMDMALDPSFAHEMIKAANDFAIDFLEAMYENGANSVSHTGEIYGVELLSPEQCHEFVVPYVKELSSKIYKDWGQKTWLHTHGDYKKPDTEPIIGEYVNEAKIAGFHPDEKHPPEWLQKHVKEKYHISIAGIIHGPGPLLNGPLEEIERVTKDAIDKAGMGGGLMLAPSCEVPPDTPPENFKRWVEFAHTYGKYPLHGEVITHANA